ncbi:MAG: PAS domain-containing protein [Nitrospirae bacterium]|nr:PAS domain-containing protein [Nitrospirota bacterium]
MRRPDLLDVLANSADGVFAVAPDDRIILWNDAAERLLGFARSEVLGRPCGDVLLGENARGEKTCFSGCRVTSLARHGRLVENFRISARHRKGHLVPLSVGIVVVPAQRPELSTVVHYLRPLEAASPDDPGTRPGPVPRENPDGGNGDAPSLTILSPREREILRFMAEGRSAREIADRLFISYATVRNHTQHILEKLHMHSKLEAVALAYKEGLTTAPPEHGRSAS